MVRVKRGVAAHKRRKSVIAAAKGFRWDRKTKYTSAKQALMKAWSYSYRDRKTKKRAKRSLWQIQINAMCREHGTTYSKFIAGLKKNLIELDRKILSGIAQKNPEIFVKVLEASSK